MKLTFIEFILGIMETWLIVYVGLALFNIFKDNKFYFKVGILNMILIFITKLFFPFFGFYTILSIVLISFLIKKEINKDWSSSIIFVLVGYILLFLGETTAALIAYNLPNVDLKTIIQNKGYIYYLIVISSKLPLIITLILIKLKKISFSDFSLEILPAMEDDIDDKY